MSRPDPKPGRKPRLPIRNVDSREIVRAKLMYPRCAACNEQGVDGHHVIPKGAPHFGDDEVANIVCLCGSGTSGCHGAFHGSPFITGGVRRDKRWVRERIGHTLERQRPDTIAYVLRKLGPVAGADYLRRIYYIRP